MKNLSKLNLTSIAFPSIGSGSLKYPPELVCHTFLYGLYPLIEKSQVQIKLVVYQQDTQIIKVHSFDKSIINCIFLINEMSLKEFKKQFDLFEEEILEYQKYSKNLPLNSGLKKLARDQASKRL